MYSIFLNELREANRAYRNLNNASRTQARESIIDVINQMVKLSHIARKDGLLSLEEAAEKMDENSMYLYLKQMMLYVVDGTDPELLERICGTRFFALDFEGEEAIEYIIMLAGTLSIQAGENPSAIEAYLLSMVSEDVSSLARSMKKRAL